MIITRTPLRISFAGGGTDLKAFYDQEPGGVFSTAINKYIYITVNPKFDNKIRASYSMTEMVEHPSQLKHELIREALKLVDIEGGVEITSISDVPSRGTGLGSSSSYTVGLLHALYAYTGQLINAEKLAREACHIEIERCGKPIGKQDQYIAAFGGFQFIQFNSDESVYVDPLTCSQEVKESLQQHLLMLYTGVTRSANDILSEQRQKTLDDANTRGILRQMRELADALRLSIFSNHLDEFGNILHEVWMLKQTLTKQITTMQINTWYERARQNGAIGGKLLGAGGGGFLLLYAPPDAHAGILRALPELRPIDFRFESQGSKIIFIE